MLHNNNTDCQPKPRSYGQPQPRNIKGLDVLVVPGTKISANGEKCRYNVSSLIYHKSALCQYGAFATTLISKIHYRIKSLLLLIEIAGTNICQAQIQHHYPKFFKFADALLVQLKTTIPLCQYSRSST
ncbi:hypothetical protein SS50377_24562 [Spironucleus salmonicida]|uniref:Uncharacterized protein n=1 Tax=Spironucleus salmonicida TaxID=348837 RepID=A0A9P8LU32_9EUKA|nr:hypothetical protein SS50377_24562 [Spironucleus salmonicida]